MKNIRLLPVSIAMCVLAQSIPSHLVKAQSDSPPEEIVVVPEATPSPIPASEVIAESQQEGPPVTIYYSDGSATATWTRGGVTQNVDIHPSESVTVQVEFAPELAGQGIIIQSLDGGAAATDENHLTVNSDGVATLSFTAGSNPGLYRVFVKAGDSTSTIRFWIPVPDDSGNPPVVTPEP